MKLIGYEDAFGYQDICYNRGSESFLTDKFIEDLLANKLVVNGSAGGLVMGPSHFMGGIYLIFPTVTNEVYVSANIEGWEYILNQRATESFAAKVDAIDNAFIGKSALMQPYSFPETTMVIDASPRPALGMHVTPFIYIQDYPVRIINRNVTKKHLAYFNSINIQSLTP